MATEKIMAARQKIADQEASKRESSQAEEALRQAEEKYRTLVEQIPLVTYIDALDEHATGIYISPQVRAMLGYSSEEFMADPELFEKITHPDDRERVMAEWPPTSGEPFRSEYRMIARDGRVVWVYDRGEAALDEDGQPLFFQGYFVDITELKRVEEELRESEERYRELFKLSPIGIWEEDYSAVKLMIDRLRNKGVHDFRRYFREHPKTLRQMAKAIKIVDVNQSLLNIYRAPDKETYQRAATDPVRKEHWVSFKEQWARFLEDELAAFAKGERRVVLEHADQAVDGSNITTRIIAHIGDAYKDSWARVVTTVEDITDQKWAEESLRESNRRLWETLAELQRMQGQIIQQERLSALGKMASGIAHDFNNALTPILGFSEVLLADPSNLDDKKKVTRQLEMINMAAKDAATVVRRLREFYRPREDVEKSTTVSLNELVGQAISLTQTKWKDEAEAKGITISIVADLAGIPPITGNETDLREALTNLILNAVDAMPNGGMITILTRSYGDHVVLEVSDTGTGMTKEVREHCLEPFFTTKGAQGTGMGLVMVYGTFQRNGGTIDIESKQGMGTTFIIRLPEQKKGKTRGGRGKESKLCRKLHILVVDDEPMAREVLTQYLIGDGHTVETAANGHEASEKFTAAQGRFDLVLTDMAMPKMNGDQLATRIKNTESKPVILLTGFGDLLQNTNGKPTAVDLVVSKPVTPSSLRAAVAKVIMK